MLDLHSFILDRQVQGLSPATVRWYELSITKFYGWLIDNDLDTDPETWTPLTLRLYIQYLQTSTSKKGEPLTKVSIASYTRSVRIFIRWLFAEKVIPEDITLRVKVPKVPKEQPNPFILDDLRAMEEEAKRSPNPLRDLAILYVFIDCGLRASEVCKLDLRDALLNQLQLVVRRGKGDKDRTVPLSVKTARAIRAYINKERSKKNPDLQTLFLSTSHRAKEGRLGLSGVEQIIYRLAKRSGVADAYPHKFRHTNAVMFLRGGGSVFALQEILGHEDLEQTRRYVKYANDDIMREHKKASPMKNL